MVRAIAHDYQAACRWSGPICCKRRRRQPRGGADVGCGCDRCAARELGPVRRNPAKCMKTLEQFEQLDPDLGNFSRHAPQPHDLRFFGMLKSDATKHHAITRTIRGRPDVGQSHRPQPACARMMVSIYALKRLQLHSQETSGLPNRHASLHEPGGGGMPDGMRDDRSVPTRRWSSRPPARPRRSTRPRRRWPGTGAIVGCLRGV